MKSAWSMLTQNPSAHRRDVGELVLQRLQHDADPWA
jgi:hypothetical protein